MSTSGAVARLIEGKRLSDGTLVPVDLRVCIVAALWHGEIMNALVAGAERACRRAGLEPTLLRVPGSFELPVAARRAAPDFDCVVALGIVIRGGTPHFDYVCQAATMGLTQVSVETGIPVGFGVLTCDDEAQAWDRAGLAGSHEDKGDEAAEAAIATATTLRGMTEWVSGRP